jgi:hypothetical protein
MDVEVFERMLANPRNVTVTRQPLGGVASAPHPGAKAVLPAEIAARLAQPPKWLARIDGAATATELDRTEAQRLVDAGAQCAEVHRP